MSQSGDGTTAAPGRWAERWLSSPRFARYLTAAGGDRQLALDLYEWNAAVSAAVLHDLAHLTTDAGLTGREVAAILKVNPGRVSQIARKAAARQAGVAKSA